MRRQEKEERDVIEAELALVKAKAFGNEQKIAEAQWALEREKAEAVEAKALAERETSEAEAAKVRWAEEQQEAAAVAAAMGAKLAAAEAQLLRDVEEEEEAAMCEQDRDVKAMAALKKIAQQASPIGIGQSEFFRIQLMAASSRVKTILPSIFES